jgi:hypothetical protein
MTTHQNGNTAPVTLELREYCEDKNSAVCLLHRNIYAEFMAKKHTEQLG